MYETEQAADYPGSSQGEVHDDTCACGHDYWDHLGMADPNRSGGGGPCRFVTCDCDHYHEGDE
jgi:hypothetical protein